MKLSLPSAVVPRVTGRSVSASALVVVAIGDRVPLADHSRLVLAVVLAGLVSLIVWRELPVPAIAHDRCVVVPETPRLDVEDLGVVELQRPSRLEVVDHEMLDGLDRL